MLIQAAIASYFGVLWPTALVLDALSPRWPWPKFREICFEIWVGPAFTRLFSRFGRSGAQERKRPTFEKLARFVSRGGSMDPDSTRCCTPRRSVVHRRYDAYNRLQGMSRCLDARPGAPRDSAPAAVYVVFGPALKKLWKQKFKLVMALPTCRYGSKVLGDLGGFIRNNTTKFGGDPKRNLGQGQLRTPFYVQNHDARSASTAVTRPWTRYARGNIGAQG